MQQGQRNHDIKLILPNHPFRMPRGEKWLHSDQALSHIYSMNKSKAATPDTPKKMLKLILDMLVGSMTMRDLLAISPDL